MPKLFTHSGQENKSEVRHKGIYGSQPVAYKRHMGNNIKSIRQAKGLTQVQVYVPAGIGKSHFSALENGHRQLNERTLNSIARVLDVDPFMILVDKSDSVTAQLFDDFAALSDDDRTVLIQMASRLAQAKRQQS